VEAHPSANPSEPTMDVQVYQQSTESPVTGTHQSSPAHPPRHRSKIPSGLKRWWERFLQPIGLFMFVIMLCTGVYTYTMWKYTNATYSLLEATKEANQINQRNFREGQKPSVYISNVSVSPPTDEKKYHQIFYTVANAGGSVAHITSVRTMTLGDDGTRYYDYPKFPSIIFSQRQITNLHILRGLQSLALNEKYRKVDVFVEISYTDSEKTPQFTREKITVFNTGEDPNLSIFFYTAEIDPKKAIIPESTE
jgi:hypothetical protein